MMWSLEARSNFTRRAQFWLTYVGRRHKKPKLHQKWSRNITKRKKKKQRPMFRKGNVFYWKKNYISLIHHENTELCLIFIRRGQDLHKKTTFFITALLHEMRLWWHLHWAFSLNSRAGLNVLWAKTLNIGLFQVLLPLVYMALIWSILNYFWIRDKSHSLSTHIGPRQIHSYPPLHF